MFYKCGSMVMDSFTVNFIVGFKKHVGMVGIFANRDERAFLLSDNLLGSNRSTNPYLLSVSQNWA